MDGQLRLEILTPNGPFSHGGDEGPMSVAGVQVPSALGELGILPGHLPVVGLVRPGVVRFVVGRQDVRLAVGGGFFEVGPAGDVSLLVERVAAGDKVEVEATRTALDEAKGRLGQVQGSIEGAEHRRASAEVEWLDALLRAAQG